MTGTTDFGVITSKAELDNHDPDIARHNPYRLAFDIFLDRVMNFVGSYHLKLGGEVDAIVFSGGIGERSVQLRTILAEKVKFLGYQQLNTALNENASKAGKVVVDISLEADEAQERPKRILVCQTDEQVSGYNPFILPICSTTGVNQLIA